MKDDSELLRLYAEEGSEEAFAEYVQRKIDFVHAIAIRSCNGDSGLAADVVQEVFIAVSRKAGPLSRHPTPEGWLFKATRTELMHQMRLEKRRREREREAMKINPITGSESEVPDIDLMDAIEGLPRIYRDTVLLRFFRGMTWSGVANELKVTEASARMRGERAIEQLRFAFERRGIASSSALLAAALANNVGMGAPAGLSLRVTQAAIAAGAGSAGIAGFFTAIFASKTALGIGAAGVVLTGAFTYLRLSRGGFADPSGPIVTVESTPLNPPAQPVASPAGAGITPGPGENSAAPGAGTALDPAMDHVAILKARLDAMPQMRIPEIDLLPERVWSGVVDSFPPVSEEAFPSAFRALRNNGRVLFANAAIEALGKYASANNGMLPARIQDLAPYFSSPMPEAVIERYVMLRGGSYDDTPATAPLIGEISGVADGVADSVIRFGRTTQSMRVSGGTAFNVKVQWAIHRYMSENGGAMPDKTEDLIRYFKPEDAAAVERELGTLDNAGR